jgi:hypothetical protein
MSLERTAHRRKSGFDFRQQVKPSKPKNSFATPVNSNQSIYSYQQQHFTSYANLSLEAQIVLKLNISQLTDTVLPRLQM